MFKLNKEFACVKTSTGVDVLLIGLIVSLVAGCATSTKGISSYDSASDRMIYQTSTITVAQGATRSFASASNITMQATARCKGKGCTPENVSLIFSVEGTSELTLSDRTLTIQYDGKEKEWKNKSSGRTRNSQVGRTEGRLAKVVMPATDLLEISNASSLTGSLGDKPLNLDGAKYELQNFVSSIREGRSED